MIKNWKSLFVKSEEDTQTSKSQYNDSVSFPVTGSSAQAQTHFPAPNTNHDPVVKEVIDIYEKGLESINMPGFDFYEFYKTVLSGGHAGEQTYKMAFHMARTLDNTISSGKLLSDAEFYISKINEVHSQYVSQGQQKLNGIQEKKTAEKLKLQNDIDGASIRVNQLRNELQQLESEITQKRNILSKVEEGYFPQEKTIREKLSANDTARNISIDKLNSIKDGIRKFIKE
jgi:hypothetical protein